MADNRIAGRSVVWMCLLYKSVRDHAWPPALAPVAFGLVVLTIGDLGVGAEVLAGHLVEAARAAAQHSTPFLLFGVLWWLAALYWRRYHTCSRTGRGMVLLLTASLGLAVAAVLRVKPYLPDAAHVVEQGARAGWQAGMETTPDAAGGRTALNGGGAPP